MEKLCKNIKQALNILNIKYIVNSSASNICDTKLTKAENIERKQKKNHANQIGAHNLSNFMLN